LLYQNFKQGVNKMGFNATVVVCLDQLDSIERDPQFGKNLGLAILRCNSMPDHCGIYGPHGTMVVEAHHADHLVPVLVGGNTGVVIPAYVGINPNEKEHETNVRMLKEMARILGFRISKIPEKKV
jgi:hypothetical protein